METLPSSSTTTRAGVRRRVVIIAGASRLVLLGLAMASNALLPDHKASGVYTFSPDDLTSPLLATFTRWDSAYFLQIAQDRGYSQLPFHAFFPLYPWCIHGLASLFVGPKPSTHALIIAGLVISNLSFIWAALMLANLSLAVHGHQHYAFLSAVVFSLSPANVFFITVYSESLYAAATFTALFLWLTRRPLWAMPCFMAASACRSNGLLNIAFLVVNLLRHLPIIHHPAVKRSRKPSFWALSRSMIPSFLMECCLAVLGIIAIALPYGAVQYYGYKKYCTNGVVPNVAPEALIWCHGRLPNMYSFIQDHYWGVGPFRYYQVKQLPNFLLATPVLLLSLAGIASYAKAMCLRAGVLLWPATTTQPDRGAAEHHSTSSSITKSQDLWACYLTPASVGLHATWAILTAFTLVMAHVQISTRLLGSACPPLYWFMALILASPRRPWHRKALLVYLGTFNLVGLIMHPNWLPWT